MSVPYPILKWRDDKEKEWTFRALHALGYTRTLGLTPDQDWLQLSHHNEARLIYPYHDSYSKRHVIWFANSGRDSASNVTFVNSGPHLISYLKRHGLAPKTHA